MRTGARFGFSATFLAATLAASSAANAQLVSAQYKLTFNSTWSAQTHPINWPGPSAHFSGLIGGTHNSAATLWQMGQLASPGIKSMAETGSKTLLTAEVNALIAQGSAGSVVSGPPTTVSPEVISMTFDIDDTHSLATIVTMIAPSPDWFVGTQSLQLRSGGAWVQSLTVPLWPYDAGTDSGTTYTSPNQPTNPPSTIAPLQGTGPFQGTPQLGTFTFELQAITFCFADCDGNGSLNVFDYICFGNAYGSGSMSADCDNNGALNVFDYICFGNAYTDGCD